MTAKETPRIFLCMAHSAGTIDPNSETVVDFRELDGTQACAKFHRLAQHID